MRYALHIFELVKKKYACQNEKNIFYGYLSWVTINKSMVAMMDGNFGRDHSWWWNPNTLRIKDLSHTEAELFATWDSDQCFAWDMIQYKIDTMYLKKILGRLVLKYHKY